MSNLLTENSYFLRLLLQTSKKQGIVILENTTPSQTLVISEIATNLLKIPLTTPLQNRLVTRNKKLLKTLGKKSLGVRAKQKLVEESSLRIYNILKSTQKDLLSLL